MSDLLRDASVLLLDAITRQRQAQEKIAEAVKGEIATLPEQQNVRKLSPQAFAIKSSAVTPSLSLDPFTYDYAAQYRYVEKCAISAVMDGSKESFKVLEALVDKKRNVVRIPDPRERQTRVFHPYVVANLTPIINQVLDLLRRIEAKGE